MGVVGTGSGQSYGMEGWVMRAKVIGVLILFAFSLVGTAQANSESVFCTPGDMSCHVETREVHFEMARNFRAEVARIMRENESEGLSMVGQTHPYERLNEKQPVEFRPGVENDQEPESWVSRLLGFLTERLSD